MSDFIPRARIEAAAIGLWHAHRLAAGFEVDDLVDGLDLSFLWEPIEAVSGRRVAAELRPDAGLIVLNEDLRALLEGNRGFYRFTVAHEVGHWELHAQPSRSGAQTLFAGTGGPVLCRHLEFGRDTDQPALPASEARREWQANLFATYLLAPGEVFRAVFRVTDCDGWLAVESLAEQLGLSRRATLVRLQEEKLGYLDHVNIPRAGVRPHRGQTSLGL
ncbi:MAG: ImmA/IrrE family metallo-endopeptidase [Candidatus Limnocylindrales bacterium]